MTLKEIFADKTLKPTERTTQLSELVLNQTITISELITFALPAKAPIKGTCIECMEYVTQKTPEIMTIEGIDFAIANLSAKAPRVQWECAKVIGNTIHLFPVKIEEAIKKLLDNTDEKSGTVVRWAAAFALGQILKLKTNINETLVPAIQNIMDKEEKNSIKKIYLDALKKVSK